LPEMFRDMDPLFLAVVCGCNAGLFREALREVYIPRIQRGDVSFAANVLGATRALLSALVHFFENGHWGSLVETAAMGQSLTEEDQLFILTQAARYLTATRESAPEAQICYERAEALCHSLNRPRSLYLALLGQWRYSLTTDRLSVTMQSAKRVLTLAQEQNNSTLIIGACAAVGWTHYYLADFTTARQYATHGVHIWRSNTERSPFQELDAQPVGCLCLKALLEWHFGEIASSRITIAEGMSLAKELNDMHGLAVALNCAAVLAYYVSPTEVDRLASDLIELSTRHNFMHWLAAGRVYRGWARSASGDTAQGITWIVKG